MNGRTGGRVSTCRRAGTKRVGSRHWLKHNIEVDAHVFLLATVLCDWTEKFHGDGFTNAMLFCDLMSYSLFDIITEGVMSSSSYFCIPHFMPFPLSARRFPLPFPRLYYLPFAFVKLALHSSQMSSHVRLCCYVFFSFSFSVRVI